VTSKIVLLPYDDDKRQDFLDGNFTDEEIITNFIDRFGYDDLRNHERRNDLMSPLYAVDESLLDTLLEDLEKAIRWQDWDAVRRAVEDCERPKFHSEAQCASLYAAAHTYHPPDDT
jgi:hypothetical protein